MERLGSIWSGTTGNRTRSLAVAASVVVFGVLLIAIGESLDWGWTRLLGAGLISVGSVGFGVVLGWSDPVRPRIAAVLSRSRRWIVVLLTVIMVTPVLMGLVLGFGGLLTGDIDADWRLTLLGLLVTVLLLAMTAGTVAVAFRLALAGVERIEPGPGANGNGRAEP